MVLVSPRVPEWEPGKRHRSMKAANEPPLVEDVLSYFIRHPQAADSLEGIARWRLLDEVVRHTVTATHEALDWLVARGLLQQEGGPGRQPVFSLVPAKKEEAERLLAELRHTAHGEDDRHGSGRDE